jgi:amidase
LYFAILIFQFALPRPSHFPTFSPAQFRVLNLVSSVPVPNTSRRIFLRHAGARGLAIILSTRIAPSITRAAAKAPQHPTVTKNDLIYRSASELARLIRSKTISSEELVRAYLDRISLVNPKLNAVCQLDEKGALAAARDADAALNRGGDVGKLHGIPVTIKDSFDVKGIVSTGGTQGRHAFVPEKDATVAARLRAAGAIILGKTNTPELTLSYDTDNLIYGRTHNPYGLALTPGGSSGGAAAILAVGGSALDIGSDTAGSIRIPAHFCGVAGLKPTFGRVSRVGHILPPGGVVGRQTHAGPMARFVEDLILALPIIAGPDAQDPEVESVALEDPATVDVTALRVGYFTDSGKRRATSEMVRAVQSATKALSDAGLKCGSARPPGLDTSGQILSGLNSADGGEYYRQLLRQHGTTSLHAGTSNFLQQIRTSVTAGPKQTDVLAAWENLRENSLKFMRDFEILICPPCSDVAPKPQHSGFLDYSYSSFFNLLGWPAAVVRVGRTSTGLPKGVQIVGRPWKEHEVLAVALLLEKKLGGWKPDFREDTLLEKA